MNTPQPPKRFSMIREFHLADWFTLGNAVCGVGALFSVMSYLETSNVVHVYFACALVLAALIIGSSIVMTVKGGPTLFGLPAFGFLGFFGAVVCGLWLVRAIWRSSHHRDDD